MKKDLELIYHWSDKLEKGLTASNFSEMKEEATKLDLAGKTKKQPPVLSTEDREIKN